MDNRKRWLVLAIVAVLVILFFNIRFLGWAVSNTTFSEVTIEQDNYPPEIWGLNDTLFVCEGTSMFSLFYANDTDGDALDDPSSSYNDPTYNLFFTFWISQTAPNTHQFAVVSSLLRKSALDDVNTGHKNYSTTVHINDLHNATCCEDTQNINITVIEINKVPSYEDIGVHTVYTSGENSIFYNLWSVNDTEFDGYSYGALEYNISIVNSTGSSVNLFEISAAGVMNFTANNSTVIDTYNITVCANDTGLTTPHSRILAECGQSGVGHVVCDSFQLTVTEENRPPNITDYYPETLSFTRAGTSRTYFNITKYDPDGTIPDAYWYVNGVFQEKDSGSSVDEFAYTYGCGKSGTVTFKAEITDGLLNDSIEWTVNYVYISCTQPLPSSSGGGGGASTPGGVAGNPDFLFGPPFITTTIFQQEGNGFNLYLNNTGNVPLNITFDFINITEMAILSEDYVYLQPGQSELFQLYLYALSDIDPGVYFGKIKAMAYGIEKTISVVIEVKDKQPLFDVKVRVPKEYKLINAGDSLKTLVDMLNVGLYGNAVDVELYLYVTNFDKIIIYELQKETLAVETNLTIERFLHIPVSTEPGTYIVLGELKYTNITIDTYDTFTVVEKKYLRISYFIIIAVILALIIFILWILYKRRKDKKERGYH